MKTSINYGQLMHKAMRSLVAEVLTDVSKDGLPGEHHFFITFNTQHPGVDIADWLHDRYPGDMTIVMQEWFDNLVVAEDRFSVTLNFGDHPEPLVIPFESIKTFVDPSVEFGLRFEPSDEENPDDDVPESPMAEFEEEDISDPKEAEVVSLDSFRKN